MGTALRAFEVWGMSYCNKKSPQAKRAQSAKHELKATVGSEPIAHSESSTEGL